MIEYSFSKQQGQIPNLSNIIDRLRYRLNHVTNGEYTLVVKKKDTKRTSQQNRLYRRWLTIIEEATGQDADMLHEFFKNKFLDIPTEQIFGEDVKKNITTTKLSTIEFTNYLDKINAFVSTELGIRLPQPNDMFFEI